MNNLHVNLVIKEHLSVSQCLKAVDMFRENIDHREEGRTFAWICLLNVMMTSLNMRNSTELPLVCSCVYFSLVNKDYAELDKKVKREIRKDTREHHKNITKNVIENFKSVKKAKKQLQK
ncbi:hypothetical protein C0J52_14205, partial [Blattella germanica]